MAGQRVAEVVGALEGSPRLRHRRFEELSVHGVLTTDVQGRGPGPSVSAGGLADLITSIGAQGVLHPVLVEEIEMVDGPPLLRLVVGERRYRACRWGATHQPGNPNFETLPALVCAGPLSEEDRRAWQLMENLAREDLPAGELAAALLLERCAVLLSQLERAGVEVGVGVLQLEDPVSRFRALEDVRGQDGDLAAPWSLVIRRLGLQLSPRRARELVAAFRALPRDLSSEMDAEQISLAARSNLARLARGRREAAGELWQAVRRLGRADLLSAAVQAQEGNPALSAPGALEVAARRHADANAARAAKLSSSAVVAGAGEVTEREAVTAAVVTAALQGLRVLRGELSAGRVLSVYDAGSLRLVWDEIAAALGGAEAVSQV